MHEEIMKMYPQPNPVMCTPFVHCISLTYGVSLLINLILDIMMLISITLVGNFAGVETVMVVNSIIDIIFIVYIGALYIFMCTICTLCGQCEYSDDDSRKGVLPVTYLGIAFPIAVSKILYGIYQIAIAIITLAVYFSVGHTLSTITHIGFILSVVRGFIYIPVVLIAYSPCVIDMKIKSRPAEPKNVVTVDGKTYTLKHLQMP